MYVLQAYKKLYTMTLERIPCQLEVVAIDSAQEDERVEKLAHRAELRYPISNTFYSQAIAHLLRVRIDARVQTGLHMRVERDEPVERTRNWRRWWRSSRGVRGTRVHVFKLEFGRRRHVNNYTK